MNLFVRISKKINVIREQFRLAAFLAGRPGLAAWLRKSEVRNWPEDLLMFAANYLSVRGQTESVRKGIPLNAEDEALPWFTYPFIDFLEDFDLKGLRVVEFGSGQSTLFWQRKGCAVTSFELDREWHARVASQINETVRLHYLETMSGAKQWLDEMVSADIVVIDAQDRLECARMIVENRHELPLIILDNADWFPKTAAYLRASGLTEIRFKGPGPINAYAWCTTLFLPPGNSLISRRLNPENCVTAGISQTAAEES